jgi:hypothetical protein
MINSVSIVDVDVLAMCQRVACTALRLTIELVPSGVPQSHLAPKSHMAM